MANLNFPCTLLRGTGLPEFVDSDHGYLHIK